MKAVTIPEPGEADALVLADVPDPKLGYDEVLVEVVAAGVNRADIMQRRGFYPPPKGASEYPGLEVSGRVVELGSGADTSFRIGDEVCALLDGGGYAQRVAVPVEQLLPIPKGVGLVDAAALPEVACTVWSNVFMTADLQPEQLLLVHGGSSGIGTMAVQLAHARGSRVAVTVGSQDKLEACRALGADILINYTETDFVEALREETDGAGADVILDVVGAKYLSRNVAALAVNGRIVVIGMLGGRKGELDLGTLLSKRGAIAATSLRARPPAEKAAIVAATYEHVWPLIAQGRVQPIVHEVLPLERAADAHRILEGSKHIGKVLLTT